MMYAEKRLILFIILSFSFILPFPGALCFITGITAPISILTQEVLPYKKLSIDKLINCSTIGKDVTFMAYDPYTEKRLPMNQELSHSKTAAQEENKMGYMPIPRLLFTMSLPIILSMLVQALYNVVDSIFVARINENALTAVSLAFPIQNLMISVATGTCVGVNALLSKSLGAKNYEQADKAASNAILLIICSYVVFAVFGIFGSRAFFMAQTSDPEIVEYGTQYLSIVCVCSIGVFLQITMERLLQSTGRTFYSMVSQMAGALTNIIMDPILIFGLFGFPEMGVAGAALATVFGQILGTVIATYCNLKKNTDIHLSLKKLRFDFGTVKAIYAVGFPSILMMSIGSVMTFGMNKILLMFSSTAAAVFGVYFKLQSFFFMPVFGMNNGLVPIIAFNYGARRKDRIVEAIRLGCIAACAMLFAGTCAFHAIPQVLLGFFNASPELTEIGTVALRIISISFIVAGFCIVIGSAFQALGNGVYTLINSICRQLVVLLPSAFVLAKLFGLNAVWWCFPLSECASLLISVILLRRIFRTKLRNL